MCKLNTNKASKKICVDRFHFIYLHTYETANNLKAVRKDWAVNKEFREGKRESIQENPKD